MTAEEDNPDATIDDESLLAVDPAATIEPQMNSDAKADWDASMTEDSDPDETIKGSLELPDERSTPHHQTTVLKQREIVRDDGSSSVANVTGETDYSIEGLLGEGGIGAVYSARQRSMDRPVAIKVSKGQSARLERSQQTFVSEAIITGSLDHPNIVPIYDVGKQGDDSPFYAMKQVQGVEWKECLTTNTEAENLDILMRVADAIAFAHSGHIIHRDLKPANIMLGDFGEVLVMDWGLAMSTKDHPRRDTFPPAKRGGTPHYMAPEMAAGPIENIDERSDIYLLGAMLYEIVTGHPPHKLDFSDKTPRQAARACLDAAATNEIAPTQRTGELVDIALKALATARESRYQTASEFQSALRRYQSHTERIALTARAEDDVAKASESENYDDYARAVFGCEEALSLWPDNSRAAAHLTEARLQYAALAPRRGDYDLALTVLDASESSHEELRTQVTRDIEERETRGRRMKRLRLIGVTSVALTAVVAVGAAIWIHAERNEADTQRGLAVQRETEAIAGVARGYFQRGEIERDPRDDTRNAALYFADASKNFEQCPETIRSSAQSATIAVDAPLKLMKHDGRVRQSILSKDNKHILTWSSDGTCRLWSTESDTAIRTFKHDDRSWVYGATFSSDESRVLTWSGDGTCRLWSTESDTAIRTFKHDDDSVVRDATFSSDESRVLTWSSDGTCRLWSTQSDTAIRTFKHDDNSLVYGATSSSDESRVLTWSSDGTCRLWDVGGLTDLSEDSVNQFVLDTEIRTGATLSSHGQY